MQVLKNFHCSRWPSSHVKGLSVLPLHGFWTEWTLLLGQKRTGTYHPHSPGMDTRTTDTLDILLNLMIMNTSPHIGHQWSHLVNVTSFWLPWLGPSEDYGGGWFSQAAIYTRKEMWRKFCGKKKCYKTLLHAQLRSLSCESHFPDGEFHYSHLSLELWVLASLLYRIKFLSTHCVI